MMKLKKKVEASTRGLNKMYDAGILLAENVRTWPGSVWSAGLSAATLTNHTLYHVRVKVR